MASPFRTFAAKSIDLEEKGGARGGGGGEGAGGENQGHAEKYPLVILITSGGLGKSAPAIDGAAEWGQSGECLAPATGREADLRGI